MTEVKPHLLVSNNSEWNASKSAWSHQPIFPQLKDYFILVEADSKLLKWHTVHGHDKYFTWSEVKWSRSVVSDSLQPIDCSPQGTSVHGILQARILEWVAISFSRGSSRPRDRTQVSRIAGRRFILWVTREARKVLNLHCEISKNREKFPISSHPILSFNHQILLNDFHVLITVFFWWRTNMQISKSLTWMFIN